MMNRMQKLRGGGGPAEKLAPRRPECHRPEGMAEGAGVSRVGIFPNDGAMGLVQKNYRTCFQEPPRSARFQDFVIPGSQALRPAEDKKQKARLVKEYKWDQRGWATPDANARVPNIVSRPEFGLTGASDPNRRLGK